jgi:hypothetical protein
MKTQKFSGIACGELEHVLVISIEMSFEFPLSNNHQVTFRAFFRVGMFVIEMAIESFPRVKYGVAYAA